MTNVFLLSFIQWCFKDNTFDLLKILFCKKCLTFRPLCRREFFQRPGSDRRRWHRTTFRVCKRCRRCRRTRSACSPSSPELRINQISFFAYGWVSLARLTFEFFLQVRTIAPGIYYCLLIRIQYIKQFKLKQNNKITIIKDLWLTRTDSTSFLSLNPSAV